MRSVTFRCRWATRCASAAVAVILSFACGGLVHAGGLSRIKYKRLATEIEVIGEAEFPEGLGPVVLHLFSDELSIHYQVHIDPEDLISTERLPKDEAKQIVAEREARLLAGQEKRKVERAERRAKRSAELARQRERQRKGLTKSSSRSRLTKSKKKSEGRYVGRSLPSMDEAMRGVEDELGSLEERLAALESESTLCIWIQMFPLISAHTVYSLNVDVPMKW